MKTHFLISVLCFLMLAACEKSNKAPDAITSIEVATRICGGLCQYNAILIKKNLSYQYFAGWTPGFEHTAKQNYFVAKVSQPFWDSLDHRLQRIDFSHLRLINSPVVVDDSFEIIIHYGSQVKRLKGSFMTFPPKLKELIDQIHSSQKTLRLKPVAGRLKFEIPTERYEDFKVSNSISISKQRGVFLETHVRPENSIAGLAILSCFAERDYYLNSSGKVIVDSSNWHKVYLVTRTATPDSVMFVNLNKWYMTNKKRDHFIFYYYYGSNIFYTFPEGITDFEWEDKINKRIGRKPVHVLGIYH